MQKKIETKSVPFRGGCNTYLEPSLLEPGKYSMVQNFRQMHPGLKKRPGQVKSHWSADSTNRVMSLFQFSKGKVTERHLFAQMSDGDVLESYAAPPIIGEELLTLDVAPATVWADGVTVTGVTSTKTCVVVKNLTTLTYIVKERSGTFTLSEVMGTGTGGADNQANQGAANPTFANAVFGDEVHNGTASGMIPASWSNYNDSMIYSNGSDQHQIYYGQTARIQKFIVYVSAAAIPDFPVLGADYTDDVTDGLSTTFAILDSLGTIAAYDCVFICVPVPINKLTWTMLTANVTASVSLINYRKNDNTWAAAAAFNDGTELLTLDVAPATPWLAGQTVTGQTSTKSALIVAVTTTTTYQISGRTGAFTLGEVLTNGTVTADQGAAHPQVATLGYTGTMTWTKPTDSIPTFMFGTYGYWYQWGLSSGALNAQTEVSAVTFESSFTSLSNMWDGVLVDGAEAQVYDNSAAKYLTFGTTSIDLDAFAIADYLYIAFADRQQALYFDVGDTPSTTGSNKIDEIAYWNGTAWTTTGWVVDTNYTDHTIGLTNSGYIILPHLTDGTEQKLCFNNTQYYAYWYRLSVTAALSATVNIGIQGIPIYDISDFGPAGVCNAPWKNRMVYTFNQYPNFIYISADGQPMSLSGEDSDIKKAGDGRANKVICMKPFYNELMVFQEEKGVEGGMITIFDGYDPSTFGRLTLSSKYGTMNSQSVEVVEGFNFGGTKDAGLVAFILSRFGILYTEGKTISHVPNFDEIRNYFDPTNANCIHVGYERHMWLKYDSAFNILRIGLVTGSGTVCNTFLTYDLTDLTWGVDSYAQELSAFTECEAASGTAPVLQMGGGVDDGFVYLLNSGLNDVTTAIDAHVIPEYDTGGEILQMDELMIRMKVQSAGTITIAPYLNSIEQTDKDYTLSQTAETATQTIRRHKKSIDLAGQHISLKIQHNTAGESCYLEDMRLKIRELSER